MPAFHWTDPAVAAFVIIPVCLAAAFALGIAKAWRRAGESPGLTKAAVIASIAGIAAWMAITAAVAQSGVLREWDRTPPPFVLLVVSVAVIAGVVALGPIGRRFVDYLPLWSLVAVQSFRLPLEIAMHGMYERGIMPVQMSYSGRNFDILTGLTAIVVAGLAATGRAGRGLVAVWNVLGLALLANIVAIAVVSTPRFHYFGNQHLNVWITYPPFVWLPAVMVLTALGCHLLIFRAIAREPGTSHIRGR